ncbi:hypothetical protein LCGC14_1271600 [marine sediment metagenome]|uniref:Uncharacterized protein n=1 Tax=marine sediment metagenome TaxID=412755 RepID=A0A0F9P0Y0_9ZZZZ
MPVAPSYIDFFKVTNHTNRPITLGDLVNVLVPAGKTVDLLKQPRVTKEKINQSQHLQIAVRNRWLTISKTNIKTKKKREKQAIVADELFELNELDDVNISGLDDDDFLQYEGGKWVNKPPTEVDVNLNVTLQTSDYTVTLVNDVILCDASIRDITITLPAAADLEGKEYSVKKIDSSENTVTVESADSGTIDESNTQIISNQYDNMQTVSSNGNWYII